MQIFKLPPKASAYINALKHNKQRNEEMVKRYQEKTQVSKEVAIQARERNSSSMTPSQMQQRSSQASVAVVVQFGNDMRKSDNQSPNKISPMRQRFQNDSDQQMAPPPTADDYLEMRRGSTKQIIYGSGRPLNQDIGTQFDQF